MRRFDDAFAEPAACVREIHVFHATTGQSVSRIEHRFLFRPPWCHGFAIDDEKGFQQFVPRVRHGEKPHVSLPLCPTWSMEFLEVCYDAGPERLVKSFLTPFFPNLECAPRHPRDERVLLIHACEPCIPCFLPEVAYEEELLPVLQREEFGSAHRTGKQDTSAAHAHAGPHMSPFGKHDWCATSVLRQLSSFFQYHEFHSSSFMFEHLASLDCSADAEQESLDFNFQRASTFSQFNQQPRGKPTGYDPWLRCKFYLETEGFQTFLQGHRGKPRGNTLRVLYHFWSNVDFDFLDASIV